MSALIGFDAALEAFPMQVSLDDDTKIELRVVTPDDRESILDFAANLPEQDLLFLRVDITKPAAVDNWIANVAAGVTVSLIAYDGEKMAGYATVDRNPARWTRRMGELRVNVGPAYRTKGLGRQLTAKIFEVARRSGLLKLMAHMTPDQKGAQAAFKRLGFVPEALLADCVEDRAGQLHDLVIMTYDVDGFTDQVDRPLQI
ncbi:MAG: GNAT family N-acetyltransferase [Pseudomonadales bacterium]